MFAKWFAAAAAGLNLFLSVSWNVIHGQGCSWPINNLQAFPPISTQLPFPKRINPPLRKIETEGEGLLTKELTNRNLSLLNAVSVSAVEDGEGGL